MTLLLHLYLGDFSNFDSWRGDMVVHLIYNSFLREGLFLQKLHIVYFLLLLFSAILH